MRPIIKNKKGQIDFPIVTFAIIVLGLIIISPVVLKVVRSTLTPTASALNNMTGQGGELASTNVNYVLGIFVNFWDGVIIFMFLFSIILLFISSFMIDSHPLFMVVYILILFLTVVFAPEILGAIDRIYEANAFATEIPLIPFIDFIRLNFGIILTAIGILTMIIIYAKLRYSTR